MPTIPENIIHYQKSIEKSENDRPRLLHCIAKLYKLPITVQHLQETGIGRTVNALRKDEGEVGVAAKALVAKWKAMVAAEESSDEDADDNVGQDDDHISPSTDNQECNKKITSSPNNKIEDKSKSSSSIQQKSSEVYSKSSSSSSSKSYRSSSDHHHHHKDNKSSKSTSSHHRSSDKSSMNKRESDYKKPIEHSGNKSKNGNISVNNHLETVKNICDDDVDDEDDDDNRDAVSDSDEKSSDNNSDSVHVQKSENRLNIDDDRKNGHYRYEKHSKNDINGCDLMKTDAKSDSNNKLKRRHSPEKYEKSKSIEVTTTNNSHHQHHHHHQQHNSSKIKHESLSHNNNSNSNSSSNNSSSNVKDSHKQHKSSKDTHKHRHESNNKSHHKSSSSSSSSRSEHKKHEKSETKHHSKTPKNDSSTDTSTNKRKIESTIDEKSSSSSKHKSSSSSSSSSAKKPKLEKPIPVIDCIDSSMGTSFADALGMIMPSKSSSKLLKSTPAKASPTATITSTKTPSIEKSSSAKSVNDTPIMLSSSVKLQPLEPELVMELPVATISNNYKPMPLNPIVMDCVFNKNNQPPLKRYMTDEEALGASFSSKNLRTKVYSGVKTGAVHQIQTLHELCTRVLQKNIDALEYTGGVPYDILKPILERATPTQLFTFEHHNPYLLDDSDELWKHHCKRNFRSQKKQDFETYREMYLRCTEEQEQRLNSLTNNIKHSQNIAIPVKQTKLAYVDSCVKPPRSVIKKQNQFGTERKLVATPAARVESLKNSCSNIAQAGDVRLKVLAGIRDSAQVGRSAAIAPKKAPLMAKTLQLMKGRFKR